MPHVNGGGGGRGGGNGNGTSAAEGEDLASSDEIKVFKDEGEVEEDKRSSSGDLNEDKSSLVTESEQDGKTSATTTHGHAFQATPATVKASAAAANGPHGQGPRGESPATIAAAAAAAVIGKTAETLQHERPFNMGYIVTPYPYANGAHIPVPVSMANKVGMVTAAGHPPSPLSFMMNYSDHFAQPPPAHMGIPPVHIDPKTGMPRPPIYSLPSPSQYPVFTPDFPMQWHNQPMYTITTAAAFRGPYSTALPVSPATIPRFSPALLGPHPHPALGPSPHPYHTSISHQAIVTPGPKQEISSLSIVHDTHLRHQSSRADQIKSPNLHNMDSKCHEDSRSPNHHSHHHHEPHNGSNNGNNGGGNKKAKSHIKKPLNAFMLYMKEMRAKVVAECTLKESAAINQILGRRWHALGREEQGKYYELARKERQLHMQLYPGWSARDNYAVQGKKKKRKRDKSLDGEGSNPKKCRARYGLDQQSSWCKPCRRKKKCIRYVDGGDTPGGDSEDVGSIGDPNTPDSKSMGDSDHEALNNSSEMSMSSPPTMAAKESSDKPSLTNGGSGNSGHHHHMPLSPLDSNHPLSVLQLTGQCNPPSTHHNHQHHHHHPHHHHHNHHLQHHHHHMAHDPSAPAVVIKREETCLVSSAPPSCSSASSTASSAPSSTSSLSSSAAVSAFPVAEPPVNCVPSIISVT